MCDSNSSATQVSYEYNICTDLVMKWSRIYTEKGPQYLDIENRGRPNMRKIKKETNKKPLTREEELEKRIKMLEMENDYLKKLQALINQFDSEEEYWQHEFEVYKINLPIEKYLNSVKQDYLNNAATIYSESEHETEHLNSCNEYLQNLQSDLAEKEDYEIME